MVTISDFSVKPVSLINHGGEQFIEVSCRSSALVHAVFTAKTDSGSFSRDVALMSGKNCIPVMLPPPDHDMEVSWTLTADGLSHTVSGLWKKPREWTFYVMLSSHTDIGLHNSQYYQRYTSEVFLDKAAGLCDATENRPEENRYRYTMEGRWFWENYPADRGAEAAEKMLAQYIRPGKIGLCAGIAGNHTNVYGFEELCRSTYGRRKILEDWGVDTRTMSMIDNNGLSWAIVAPYAEAGYENILFAPNHWNPRPSTVWHCDQSKALCFWNPNAGGGGSRVDVRYDSELPMLFFWRSPDDTREMLVWASTHYPVGGEEFGFNCWSKPSFDTLAQMEKRFTTRLPEMEDRVPYDVWLLASYADDQEPSIDQTDLFAAWNARWKYPRIRTLGAPDEPFRLVRERFGDRIPVLKGEMTGGWYQHPLSAPQLLADKLNADRALASAETWASLAALYADAPYPAEEFSRAWEYLFWNDEHSYGVSGYQGRRVYETWMQHRDWIEKAAETARSETESALDALSGLIPCGEDSVIVFNPTSRVRDERIRMDGREGIARELPPCGYKVVPLGEEAPEEVLSCAAPPVVENEHYKIRFAEDGSMASVYDKKIGKELLSEGTFGANCFVYTEDNHKSFVTPRNASFTVTRRDGVITVTAEFDEPRSGAAVTQIVTLDSLHHRIDIENRIRHMRAMVNDCRYDRYLYYAFPFHVPGARRICQLNGGEAEYAVDLTGHGTDTYMSAHEWALAENDSFGAALLQKDSLLVEFDHIHPDKTDCGAAGSGSAIFSYAANDWLQMHEVGGSHVNLTLRYAITSWAGRYQEAGLREEADCFVHPVVSRKPAAGKNGLPAEKSFLRLTEGQRLVCLKRAESGDGMIARTYGQRSGAGVRMEDYPSERCRVDELPADEETCTDGFGFSTFRIKTPTLPRRADTPDLIDEKVPAPIGSVWTGLITKPRAARGESDGLLYLIWGQNMEKNLSHYELYRSETSGFTPSEETFVAKVEPGVYRTGLYIDQGLRTHTAYFYRVRAVNTEGAAGAFSDEFSGITQEITEE